MKSLFESVDKGEGMMAALDHLGVVYKPSHVGWQKVRCPFTEAHKMGDRNPSGSVNLSYGAFNCHACGNHGDWARLLYDIEGMKINEAVKLLGLEKNGSVNDERDGTADGLFLY